ncbi:MAG: tetratricopeptide repeat protein [Gammaproteobacteria bacterium]|nr:tetratricopeptide repeat protein [Gammaproteobacteria bacterium]
MDTYQTEDEQVQAIKDWWKENGRSVIAGLIIGIGAIVGYRYWTNYQTTQSEQASLIYAQVIASATSADNARAFEQGKSLISDYSGTPYAALSALTLSKLALDKTDYATAAAQLRWVIDNSSDDGLKHVARLRLARVLAAQDKPDLAISLLNEADTSGFTTLYQETRGDILLQQGKVAEAAVEYSKAMEDLEMNPQRRRILEMKFNDLAVTTQKVKP